MITGVLRGSGDLIGGINDFTALLLRFAGSGEYRAKTVDFAVRAVEYTQQHSIPWSVASQKIIEIAQHISSLPAPERASAYARALTNIAGIFAIAGAVGALGKARA